MASPTILDTSDTLTYNLPYSLTVPRESWCAGDATGRFSPPSRLGHEYLLVTVFHGYIFAVPMINRSSKSYVKAYTTVITFFSTCGHPFTHLSLDNEKSADLTALFKTHKLSIQYVPPQQHRANPAERAIRTYKNHFIAILSAVHPSFPADLWHLLLPLTELTLNHLRPWTPNRKLSAHRGLHGHRTDLLAHPLPPPRPTGISTASWDHHGVRAFYLGPALDHYRSHRVYVVKTGSTRVTDTLAHFPIPLFHFAPPDPIPPDLPSDSRPDPQHDGSDLIGRWFHEPELGTCSVIGLAPPFELVVGAGNRTDDDYIPPGWHQTLSIRLASGRTERCSVTEVARWYAACPHTPPPAVPLVPPPRPRPGLARPAAGPPAPLALVSTGVATPSTGVGHTPTAISPPPGTLAIFSTIRRSTANLNLDPLGNPLTFQSAIRGPNKAEWVTADSTELTKLVLDTGTLEPRHTPSATPTYYNRVVKEKPADALPTGVQCRVRGTAGGDRVKVPYSCSSATASLPTVKILLNAVVSEDNSRFGTIDLTDYYLGSQ